MDVVIVIKTPYSSASLRGLPMMMIVVVMMMVGIIIVKVLQRKNEREGEKQPRNVGISIKNGSLASEDCIVAFYCNGCD